MRIVRNQDELAALVPAGAVGGGGAFGMAISTWRSTSSIRATSSPGCLPMNTATCQPGEVC